MKNKVVKILIVGILIIGMQLPIFAATTGIVNVDTVRVRKKATTDSSIVELVSIGDKITITGEEGDWYKVKVGKVEGYIRKDLLTVEGEIATSTEPENNAGESNEPVETPSEDVPEVDTPAEEKPVESTQNENDESVTEIKGEKISTLKSAEGVSAGNTVQLTEEIKIKILPSANSTNIEKLEANTLVKILEVVNKWCRVETAEGACGWVRIDQ